MNNEGDNEFKVIPQNLVAVHYFEKFTTPAQTK